MRLFMHSLFESLSTGDQREKPFHPPSGARSTYIEISISTIPVAKILTHLSGLKSLVTIDPGSMTRDSFGRSVLAKVYRI